MVPNDVVFASGTGASVGKVGEKKGGSQYQESAVEAEWDLLFCIYCIWTGEQSCCNAGMLELKDPLR